MYLAKTLDKKLFLTRNSKRAQKKYQKLQTFTKMQEADVKDICHIKLSFRQSLVGLVSRYAKCWFGDRCFKTNKIANLYLKGEKRLTKEMDLV